MKPTTSFAPAQAPLWTGKSLGCALLTALALLLSGCSHRGNQAGGIDPSGTYNLVSVDGRALPATIRHGRVNLEVRSGQFSIEPDGTCRSVMVFVPPSGQETTREVKATYTQNGAALRMRWERAGITTGTVKDDTFTMKNEGMTLAYKK